MLILAIVLLTHLLKPTVIGLKDQGCHQLPTWITDNPAFKTPTKINSVESGSGSIVSNKTENLGWVVELNSEPGYGIEIVLEQLQLGTDSNDYLIIAGWPVSTTEFKQIKLYTGKLITAQVFRILNSKEFFILMNAKESKIPPYMVLTYKRFGNSYHTIPPSVKPPAQKDSMFEIFLKGRKPQDYFDASFRAEIKQALRTTAEAFCQMNGIPFNSSILIDEMVVFHRISLCPYEWPERDICIALEHSIYVFGELNPRKRITYNYELTSDHLRTMWFTSDLRAIENLGIGVFELPETKDIFVWWVVVIGITIGSSLVLVVFFWKMEKHSKRIREESTDLSDFEVITHNKRPKFKKLRQQQIPSFMLKASGLSRKPKYEEGKLTSSNIDNLINSKEMDGDDSTQTPIKNYIGSLLFSSNSGFENDEDEMPRK
ncbi:hypothetical protein RUM43_005052 [Polyplax serrata]|uniref:Uncharacterized protein n=1 Tax=Polyplax serrata TaxID=468196 RepID=A0AAN8XR15_POLSC